MAKRKNDELTIEQQMSRIKHGAVFFGIMFFIVMLVVVVASIFYLVRMETILTEISKLVNSTEYTNINIDNTGLLSTDYLAVVIPVLVALAGSFVAFLGMNRLKMFDERIDKMRLELSEEIEKHVTLEVQTGQAKFIQDISSKMNKALQEINEKASDTSQKIDEKQTHYINTAEEKNSEALNKLAEIVANGINQINERTNDFGNRFSWLIDLADDSDIDLNIHTVYDAHANVERLRSEQKSGGVNLIKKIVRFVCDKTDIPGDSSDYHNLAAELARGNLFDESCKVLKTGLSHFENDMDLLADYVEYAAHIGLHDEAKDIVEKLNKNKRAWNWRCFEFVCDYYRGIGDLSTALSICSEAIDNIPDDEHGYRSKAEIQRLINPGKEGIEAAVCTLNTALDRNVNCPQCAVALSDIYLGIGKYEEALSAADRAIQELAQDQPHVNIAAVFFKRASIQDRMLMSKKYSSEKGQELADNAYTDYAMALSLPGLPPAVKMQARIRQQIIEKYLSSDYVKKDTNINSLMSEELRQLISSRLYEQIIGIDQDIIDEPFQPIDKDSTLQ